LVTPLAIYGGVVLRRSGTFFWPLLAPVLIALLVVTVTFGDPRFRAPADLGIVVLAAAGLDQATGHLRNRVAQMR
jgi:hypothetical protein